MSITRETIIDKIIINNDGELVIKEKIIFTEGGIKVGEHVQKKHIFPGDSFENESEEIKQVLQVVHTDKKVQDYKNKKKATAM